MFWPLCQWGNILLIRVSVAVSFSAVAPHWTTTKRIYHSQRLGVFGEFQHIGVITGSTPLPLTSKELLKRVLA